MSFSCRDGVAPRRRGAGRAFCLSVPALASSPMLALGLFFAACGSASALSERELLVRFYNLANGKHWMKADGWAQAAEAEANGTLAVLNSSEYASVCSWYGVVCSNSSEGDVVTALDLSYNHLSGKVSQHLWTLPHLKEVNLHGNLLTDAGLGGFALSLNGTSAASPSPLESLYLSENRLSSLEGISNAPHTLRRLHFGSNAFEGPFPEEVFKVISLHHLRASYNAGITGTLSSHIGLLKNLRELEISYTGLRGEIPTQLGVLAALQFLSLDENHLHSTIPFELEDLINLKYLSISNAEPVRADGGELGGGNKIIGPLPAFKDCANLKELYLDNNELGGTIPPDLLEFSLLSTKEVTVGLRNNTLTGKIPSELADRFERLHIELGGNSISYVPNDVCAKSKWMSGSVGTLGCGAILCPKGTFRAWSGRLEGFGTDVDKCAPCPNGEQDAPHFGSTSCGVAASSSAASSSSSNKGTPVYAPPSYTPSSTVGRSSLGGGAKFGIVLASLVGVLGAALLARRVVRRRRYRREEADAAMNAELERQGVVFNAADAGHSLDMNAGDAMSDVPLGNSGLSGGSPSSPGVNRCIL